MNLKKRLREPTTILGLGALISGLGMIFKIDEAPAIADAVSNTAEPLANGDYATAATFVISGLFGIFMSEKGEKK